MNFNTLDLKIVLSNNTNINLLIWFKNFKYTRKKVAFIHLVKHIL